MVTASYDPAPEQLTYRPRFDRKPHRHGIDDLRRLYLTTTTYVVTTYDGLIQYVVGVKDQGAEGSCTANAACGATESSQAVAGNPNPPALARMQLYRNERLDEGSWPQDAGASVEDSVDSQTRHGGLVFESVWPYDANPSESPPPAVANAPLNLWVAGRQPVDMSSLNSCQQGIFAALTAKTYMVIGLTVYENMMNQWTQTGIWSDMGGGVAGGHEIYIIGAVGACAAIAEGGAWCRNSWGKTSPARTDINSKAQSGDLFIPWSVFMQIVDDVQVVTPAVAPSPTPSEQIVVSASIPTGGSVGAAVVMSASVSGVTAGDTALVSWDFGDGTQGTGASAGHAYQTAGAYTVKVFATDSQTGVQSAVVSGSVSISGSPTPTPPPPAPSPQAAIDADFAATEAQLQSYAASAKGNISVKNAYLWGIKLEQYEQGNVDAILTGGLARGAPPRIR